MGEMLVKKGLAILLMMMLFFSFPALAEKVSILCAAFPQYDTVMRVIAGHEEQFNVQLLMHSGVDLHNYQPSAMDIARVASCQLMVVNGGESDTWLDHVLGATRNNNMKLIRFMDLAATHQEEALPGLTEAEEEDDAADEHVWLSLNNMKRFSDAVCGAVIALDAANAADYKANCDQYIEALTALDAEYTQMVAAAKLNTVIVADRFPFLYLMRDYGLNYYAAFSGCSAESEASFETMALLIRKTAEVRPGAVLVTETSDRRLADTVAQSAGISQVLTLNAVQSVTDNDIQNGVTYLTLMKENLSMLRQALNPD